MRTLRAHFACLQRLCSPLKPTAENITRNCSHCSTDFHAHCYYVGRGGVLTMTLWLSKSSERLLLPLALLVPMPRSLRSFVSSSAYTANDTLRPFEPLFNETNTAGRSELINYCLCVFVCVCLCGHKVSRCKQHARLRAYTRRSRTIPRRVRIIIGRVVVETPHATKEHYAHAYS